MNRRDQIQMTDAEISAFLAERHTMSLATMGPGGRIHLVAMWYGFLGSDLAVWSYRRSQKVVNLERDPRLTCLIEAGERYEELRGVELSGRGVIIREPDQVLAVGHSARQRYLGDEDDHKRGVEAQAAKRVAIRIEVDHTVSWDHRKLPPAH
jgi:PPOX class probable F420-dependent enzyme